MFQCEHWFLKTPHKMYTKELMNHISDYLRRIIELQVLDITKTSDRGNEIVTVTHIF